METITIQSLPPVQVTNDKGQPVLDPGVLTGQLFVKWQLLKQGPWANESDPVHVFDCHHLMYKGEAIRPFATKIWLPTAVEMTDAQGKLSWGILVDNNDETNTINLIVQPSRRAAYFNATELWMYGTMKNWNTTGRIHP